MSPPPPQSTSGKYVMGIRGSGSGERETHVQILVPDVLFIDHTWVAHALWASVSPAVKWAGYEAAVRLSAGLLSWESAYTEPHKVSSDELAVRAVYSPKA